MSSTHNRTIAAASLILGSLLACSVAQAETLVYEREFTLIAEADNSLRMTLDPDGRLTIDRPAFMTHPGRHQIVVSPDRYLVLNESFQQAEVRSSRASANVLARAEDDIKVITDPEISRFSRLDEAGRKSIQVSGQSIGAWAAVYPDQAGLIELHELEQAWYALMRQALSQDNQQAGDSQ